MAKSESEKKKSKNIAFIVGLLVTVLGLAAILAWWPDVIIFVRGVVGMALAVGGLLIMYFVKKL